MFFFIWLTYGLAINFLHPRSLILKVVSIGAFFTFYGFFCSTGVYSDYTSSFLLRHQYFFVLFNFSNKKRVRKVLAPPFSLRRAG